MRLERLDLTRYGHFTAASLPFAPGAPDEPDLHLVYGDNEAGKTTTLDAMLDLLFGFERSTPYAFLHQPNALRLGGVLDTSSGRQEVIRVPRGPLLAADERPLPDGLSGLDLSGLDRETYRTMFSLDERSLAAGGESILACEGEVGRALFSATAGLSDLNESLSKLRQEADAFYRTHGRKHLLGDLKKTLLDLKERRARVDVLAAPYARLIAARDAASAAYEVAVAERGRLAAEREEVSRHIGLLPRAAEWRDLAREIEALPPSPSVPQGWPEEATELQARAVELSTLREATVEEIARLDADVAATPIDESAVALAPHMRRLGELRSRDETAAEDLPARRAALRAARTEAEGLLSELGRPGCDPRALLLPSGVAERLRRSVEALSGIESALSEARGELAAAEARLAVSTQALAAKDGASGATAALAEVKAALAAAEAEQCETRHRFAVRAARDRAAELASRMADLAPWGGDVSALRSLDVPDREERARIGRAEADATRAVETLRRDLERLGDEEERLRRRRRVLEGGDVVDDAEAAQSRAAREEAWLRHLEVLDRGSAESFERALRADDAVARARLAQAAALSDLRAVDLALADIEVGRQATEGRLSAARDARDGVTAETSHVAVAVLGVEPAKPLAALETFAARRELALEAARLAEVAERGRSEAVEDLARIAGRLASALRAAGAAPEEGGVALLSAEARAFLERRAAADAARAEVASRAEEVDRRRRRLEIAREASASWSRGWVGTLRSTWFADDVEVEHVRDALDVLARLESVQQRADGLADRVAKMEADRACFAAEVDSLANLLGMPTTEEDDCAADAVEARVSAALSAAAFRRARLDDMAVAEGKLARLRPDLDAAERRMAEMAATFSVASAGELAVAFQSSRRREELTARMRALGAEIRAGCGTDDVRLAVEALSAFDADILRLSCAELDARLGDQVERTQELYAALGRARDEVAAVAADDEAARLDGERGAILLEIEERTLAHLTMRAGIIAADRAISDFRDRHRSTMMRDASAVFRDLTRGAYDGLAAQGVEGRELIVGLRSDGGSKLCAQMSTATRNQLYLALRVAAYREFAKTRRPVPFVLDDVLETFDDDRAEAALVLLSDVARVGQVVYLTHHRHLCEIATRICPSARVYDLGRLTG